MYPGLLHLLYHFAIDRRAASFIVFFEKIIHREWQSPDAYRMSGYQRCLIISSCTASQASFRIWNLSIARSALGKAVRIILSIESERSSVTSRTVRRFSSSIFRSTAITSSDFVPATTATNDRSLVQTSRFVTNVYSSPLDSNGKTWSKVVGKQHPLASMFELIPLPIATEHFLILLLERMSVHMIEILKRTAGHRDVSIRLF